MFFKKDFSDFARKYSALIKNATTLFFHHFVWCKDIDENNGITTTMYSDVKLFPGFETVIDMKNINYLFLESRNRCMQFSLNVLRTLII